MNENKIVINNVEYTKSSSIKKEPEKLDGMEYCVVRTYSAGVHIGYVKEFGIKSEKHGILINSRRLYSWSGALTLSEVAMNGVDKSSKISVQVPKAELTEIIEIIECSFDSAEFFKGAKSWKKK